MLTLQTTVPKYSIATNKKARSKSRTELLITNYKMS